MPSRARLEWNGDRLIERVRRAARQAVNDTVDAARDDARVTHAWQSPSERFPTDLESEIKSVHANVGERNPTGRFGYMRRRGFHGLFHEEGTVREHEYPALRPAADREFPRLLERIRRRLRDDR